MKQVEELALELVLVEPDIQHTEFEKYKQFRLRQESLSSLYRHKPASIYERVERMPNMQKAIRGN